MQGGHRSSNMPKKSGSSRRRPATPTTPSPAPEGPSSVHHVEQMSLAPPPPVLPRFHDGLVDDFITEAKRVVAIYKFNPPAAAEFVIRHLDGPAKTEVQLRNPQTPEEVFNVLEEVFGDHRDLQSLLHSFHGRRQGIGEGILGYSHAVQVLAARVKKIDPSALSDAMLRDKFVNGLHPPSLRKDIKKFVRDNASCDLIAARTEAMRWMREDDDASFYQEAVRAAPNEVETLRKQLAAVTKELNEMKAKQREPRRNNRIVCFFCQKPGHLKRDCKRRKDAEWNARSQPPAQYSPRHLPPERPSYASQPIIPSDGGRQFPFHYNAPQPAPTSSRGMPYYPTGLSSTPQPPPPSQGN